jgi:hypothetical protein
MYAIHRPTFGNTASAVKRPSGQISETGHQRSSSVFRSERAMADQRSPETPFTRNLRFGFHVLGKLMSSYWDDRSVKGRIFVALDFLMTFLSFVPFLHFLFLLSPSAIKLYRTVYKHLFSHKHPDSTRNL